MKSTHPWLPRSGCLLAGALAAILLAGCDDYSPSDHEPPEGMGAIIVNNHTYSDINVYIDGVEQRDVGGGQDRAYDRSNGVYRVVLTEEDGIRSFSGDVDVLQDQNTILDVTNDSGNAARYDVFIYFDKP